MCVLSLSGKVFFFLVKNGTNKSEKKDKESSIFKVEHYFYFTLQLASSAVCKLFLNYFIW